MQKYKSNITNTNGDAVRNAPVSVFKEDGTLATLFLDRAGLVPAANPLTTETDGTFAFYAVNGRYSLSTTVSGATITDADVVLLLDPDDMEFGQLDEAIERSEAAAAASEQAASASATSENNSLQASQQSSISAIQANADATVAQQARQGAEAARDAAVIGAEIYPDEPTGRAAVADGESFKVQGSGAVAAFVYRRIDASTSVLLATYPSSAAVTDIGKRVQPSEKPAFHFLDGQRNSLGFIRAGEVDLPTMRRSTDSTSRTLQADEGGNISVMMQGAVMRVGALAGRWSEGADTTQVDARGNLISRASPRRSAQVSVSGQVFLDADVWATGRVLHLPALNVGGLGLSRRVVAQDITLADTGSQALVNQPYSIEYSSTPAPLTSPSAWLPWVTIRSVSARPSAGGPALVQGVDYSVLEGGKLRKLASGTAISALIDYTGVYARYDLVQVNLLTGAITVKQGTARAIDPEEYMPVADAGCVGVCMALVRGDVVDVTPLVPRQVDFALYQSLGAEREERHRRNRERLAGLWRRLEAGLPVAIAGYGDSITAIGSGVSTPLVPGANRDRIGFLERLPDDTKALVPQYSSADPDFAGSPYSDQVKIGWNWHLIAWLRRRYSNTITYANWGVAGTTSAATETGDPLRPNGSNPARLAAMTGSNPNLVVIAFGMNEIGTTDTTGNMVTIINACKAVGAEVIVMGVPRRNAAADLSAEDAWLQTNFRLQAAADFCNVAFVPTVGDFSDARLGLSPFALRGLCGCNFFNHPGPAELAYYGRLLVDFVKE